ncbi:methyltransferase domain-containing protein [Maribacter sp. R77961]|uniref:methyltransferase domain-containing protein n=1 Tax=Maribacter sp. R77961 TaxID=3093871 RepID=UPI0037CB8CBE
MVNFKHRSEQEEIMDNYDGSKETLKIVLDDITRVNKILGGNTITVDAVFRLIEENPKESYTILDMGCADGNMLRLLADSAKKQNRKFRLIGVDLNGDALDIAREASKDYPEITYYEKNILSDDFSNLEVDIIITTLTMHHFKDADILTFMRQFIKLSSIGIVINDLQRSRLAYYLFQIFSLIFIKTKVAKIDGLISISKGFRKQDLEAFANTLKGVSHAIKWKWAFRYVWVLRKKRL